MKKFFTLILACTVAGCAQYSIPATDSDTSAVAFTERMTVAMSSKLDKLLTPAFGSVKNSDGYRTFETTFFPTEGGLDGINKSWTSYCKQRGGEYSNRACEDGDGDLIFFAKAWLTGGKGSTTPQHAIYVIEPIGTPGWKFMKVAEAAGYKTRGELQIEKDTAAMNQFNRAAEIERRKSQNANAILQSGVGSRVCKDTLGYGLQADLREIGFVEKIENKRIKVSVAHSEIKGTPDLRPSGFQPYIGWFPPTLWHLC